MHKFDGDPFRHRLVWFGADWASGPDQTVVTIQDVAGGMVFIGNPDDAAVILAGLQTDGRVH